MWSTASKVSMWNQKIFLIFHCKNSNNYLREEAVALYDKRFYPIFMVFWCLVLEQLKIIMEEEKQGENRRAC